MSANTQKIVLITGGTDGLGKATAVHLAERGYGVIAAGRSASKRVELETLAKTKSLPLSTVEMDVCSDASVNSHRLCDKNRMSMLMIRSRSTSLRGLATTRRYESKSFTSARSKKRTPPMI